MSPMLSRLKDMPRLPPETQIVGRLKIGTPIQRRRHILTDKTDTDHPKIARHQPLAHHRAAFGERLMQACAHFGVVTLGQAEGYFNDLHAWPAARASLGVSQEDLSEAVEVIASLLEDSPPGTDRFLPPPAGLSDVALSHVPVPDLRSVLPAKCALCLPLEEFHNA